MRDSSDSSPDEMSSRIGVVDYGGGNLRNVLNVLKHLGHEGSLVSGPRDLETIDRLVFPGVGAFGDCAAELDRRDLRSAIAEWVHSDRPYFGICLGYQVLFERSSECPGVKGLGVFAGEVVQFPLDRGLKVPHMGWNRVDPVDRSLGVWKDAPDPLYLYFVHSYYPVPSDSTIIASTTEYGDTFASSIASGQVFAGQFHPERSQEAGLRLMRNFLAGSPAVAAV